MFKRSRAFWVCLGLLAFALAAYLTWKLLYAPDDLIAQALRDRAKETLAAAGIADGMKPLLGILARNYEDTRANATQWSGVFWGFSFAALIASASAGVILKLESLQLSEAARKDLAAALAFVSAVLVGLSTTGDFQRKWQANRIAAAKLEKLGYDLLGDDRPDVGTYYVAIGEIQYERTMLIAGESQRKPREPAGKPAEPAGK